MGDTPKPSHLSGVTLLTPGDYAITYTRADFEPVTVALTVTPGVGPVTAPPPAAWRPTAALSGLQKLEAALKSGDMAVADGLVKSVSAGSYQSTAHGERARQAFATWRKTRTAGVTKHWRTKEYAKVMEASEALAKVFTSAGDRNAADVCRFNAALCRYLGQQTGSERRLQAAEDVLVLASSSGVRAATTNQERVWLNTLKRKLGGYVKLRKSGSAFASMDEGAATNCIKTRDVPFPLPTN